MKSLSIRLKITLWFSAVLVVVVFFTYLAVLSVSRQIIQKTIKDSLIETVENNVDEVEFYHSLDDIDSSNDVDHYVKYIDGYLEIDDDFLNHVNEVYTALYKEDVTLLYGENPISKETSNLKFSDSQIQQLTVKGTIYYIFDRKLSTLGLESLWLRGVVSEAQGAMQMSNITRLSLIILPLLVLVAVTGGYLIAGSALRPIRKITDTAAQIGKGDDLKKRIELGRGNDELHQLANSFNDMFQRLDDSFETERQFTSDASHELRTPISVIKAQCDFSLEEPRDAEAYEKALRVIQRQSKKMSKLVNDMLNFTRLETRADSYVREPIDLTELVSSTCSDMAYIQENNITLKCEAEANVKFHGNRELLSRLLVNLISNAYRYGNENGHILVRLKSNEQEITLSVSDDGIGIAKEEQNKIFRRFYQTDNSRTSAGTGLGLSMVYEIAQFHKGEIRVESELHRGSTFTLILPN